MTEDELKMIEKNRIELTETLIEATNDLLEFGDIGVAAYLRNGAAFDYMLSAQEPIPGVEYTEEELHRLTGEPPVGEGVEIEPMRISEFIDRLQYTIAILGTPYKGPITDEWEKWRDEYDKEKGRLP
ncbi:MAG: hypothetical protein Q4E22_03230 [Coriobacteriia bacterium]|nr:hypothetical protein [Coriobacteriia bacterium]